MVTGGTLQSVAALLGTPESATIGWVHFLAFDLFAGRWVYLDSRERGVSPWVMAPVLFLTLMFGPLGFLLYLGVRGVPALRERARPPVPARARAVPAAESARDTGVAAAHRFRALRAVDGPLALVAALMVPFLLLGLGGIALDPTVVAGAPAWLKPVKFAVSISIYSFTLLWMLSRVEGRRRLVRRVGTLTAAAFLVEWGVIALQAWRGNPSHFNASTPLDAALFGVMGVFVVVLWTMNLLGGLAPAGGSASPTAPSPGRSASASCSRWRGAPWRPRCWARHPSSARRSARGSGWRRSAGTRWGCGTAARAFR